MASIKLNDFVVSVDNGTVIVNYKNESQGAYWIDYLLECSGDKFILNTGIVIEKEIFDVLCVYLKQMKLYPKNNQEKF
jgi:hypothetical protein